MNFLNRKRTYLVHISIFLYRMMTGKLTQTNWRFWLLFGKLPGQNFGPGHRPSWMRCFVILPSPSSQLRNNTLNKLWLLPPKSSKLKKNIKIAIESSNNTWYIFKSYIFRDITPCSPLKVTFRKNMSSPSSGLLASFTLVSCLDYSSTLKMFRNFGSL
jgi:hypothetical protein